MIFVAGFIVGAICGGLLAIAALMLGYIRIVREAEVDEYRAGGTD